jgi:hypothetical protein
MITIEFDSSESCSLEGAQAIMDLLAHVTALEKAGTIKDVYMTTDIIEAELDAMAEQAIVDEQPALEGARPAADDARR